MSHTEFSMWRGHQKWQGYLKYGDYNITFGAMILTCGRGILSSEKLARLKLSPCVRFSSIGGVLLFVVLSKCAFLAWGIFRFNVPPEEIFSTRFSLLNDGADELLLWHVLSVVWIFHLKWEFLKWLWIVIFYRVHGHLWLDLPFQFLSYLYH